jgi:hypothetical protein
MFVYAVIYQLKTLQSKQLTCGEGIRTIHRRATSYITVSYCPCSYVLR